MNIHSVSLKGRRDSNEDKHKIEINSDKRNKDMLPINFFAVYDGHGGKFVSKYLSNNLRFKRILFILRFNSNVFKVR